MLGALPLTMYKDPGSRGLYILAFLEKFPAMDSTWLVGNSILVEVLLMAIKCFSFRIFSRIF